MGMFLKRAKMLLFWAKNNLNREKKFSLHLVTFSLYLVQISLCLEFALFRKISLCLGGLSLCLVASFRLFQKGNIDHMSILFNELANAARLRNDKLFGELLDLFAGEPLIEWIENFHFQDLFKFTTMLNPY